jgi:hypothetical protein
MRLGAIYIITQDHRYVNLMLNSVASLKRVMPNLPVTVFSQFPIESPMLEQVVQVDASSNGFYDKTVFMRKTPYERTLFIDADTYIVDPVPELFTVLDNFDCAATHEEYLSTDWWNDYPRPDIPASFPEFNTGIMAFGNSPRMRNLLDSWVKLYESFMRDKPGGRCNDQQFFRAVVYSSDIRMATLTREYNCKFRGQGFLNGRVKILHGHVDLQLPEPFILKAAKVLNATTRPRVYIAGKVYQQKLVGRILDRRKAGFVGSFPLLPEPVIVAGTRRLRKMLKERGPRQIIMKALRLPTRAPISNK